MIANSRNGQKMDRQLMDDLLETLEIGSLCALGGRFTIRDQKCPAVF